MHRMSSVSNLSHRFPSRVPHARALKSHHFFFLLLLCLLLLLFLFLLNHLEVFPPFSRSAYVAISWCDFQQPAECEMKWNGERKELKTVLRGFKPFPSLSLSRSSFLAPPISWMPQTVIWKHLAYVFFLFFSSEPSADLSSAPLLWHWRSHKSPQCEFVWKIRGGRGEVWRSAIIVPLFGLHGKSEG